MALLLLKKVNYSITRTILPEVSLTCLTVGIKIGYLRPTIQVSMANHNWVVKNAVLPYIADGSKDLEIRVGHPCFAKVQAGDVIIFNGRYWRRVTAIRKYPGFKTALAAENHLRIFPALSKEKLLEILQEKLKGDIPRLGVLIFELEPV